MKKSANIVLYLIFLVAASATVSAGEPRNQFNAAGFTLVKGNYSGGTADSLVGKNNLYIDYAAKNDDGTVNAVIEIPTGTNDKWKTDISTGHLFLEQKNKAPDFVNYLGYPANCGFIPRTRNGNGDPLDVLILGGMLQRGTVTPVKVIGVLRLTDNGKTDDKIIAVLPGTFIGAVERLSELDDLYPGISSVLATWFVNYRGVDASLVSSGFNDVAAAKAMIDSAIVDTNVTVVPTTLARTCDDSLTDTSYTRSSGVYGAPAGVPGSCDSLSNGKNMYYKVRFANESGTINAFTEIPGGTNSKWETSHENGKLFWENKGGLPRVVKYLGYPLSYGMIPQTAYYDGDPLDIVVLGASLQRGSVTPVKLIGVVNLIDAWVVDDKLVAVLPGGPMSDVDNIAELNAKYPGVSTILGIWFSNYKGIGGNVSSTGLMTQNPWPVLDTGITLFGKFYPEGVSTPKTAYKQFTSRVRMLSNRMAAVSITLDKQQLIVIALHSVNGRAITSKDFGLVGAGSRTMTVDMGNCAPGCYMLQISTGASKTIQPILLN